MEYTTEQKRQSLLLQCRLYNGEDEDPYQRELDSHIVGGWELPPDDYTTYKYDIPQKEVDRLDYLSVFWCSERCWLEYMLGNNPFNFKSAEGDYVCSIGKDFEANDNTPYTLKVFLYTVFIQHYDGVFHRATTLYELSLFQKCYKKYYSKLPTNREIRAQKRIPSLLKKCKYYQGEKTNPWKYCYADRLVKRRFYWEREKEWVEKVSQSFESAKHDNIKKWHLVEFFKANDAVLSLAEHIILYEKNKSKKDFGPAEAVKAYEWYTKYAPIGYGPEKYFAFFNGEKDCPYEYSSTDHSGLLWLQESIVYGNLQTNPKFLSGKNCFLEDEPVYDGVDGWMHDKKYPAIQRDMWLFIGTNIATWMAYADLQEIGEQYIGFKYKKKKSL